MTFLEFMMIYELSLVKRTRFTFGSVRHKHQIHDNDTQMSCATIVRMKSKPSYEYL